MRLPPETLRRFYTDKEIGNVVKRRPFTAEEIERAGGHSARSCEVVSYDAANAATVFTRPVTGSYHYENLPMMGQSLYGNAHLHIDEAGVVWITDILLRAGIPLLGNYATSSIVRDTESTCTVEMASASTTIRFSLEKGRGLLACECTGPDGTRITVKRKPN